MLKLSLICVISSISLIGSTFVGDYYYYMKYEESYGCEGSKRGETCNVDTKSGVCKKFRDCQAASDDLMNGIRPKTCGFDQSEAIVCCVSSPSTTAATTTEDGDYADYEDVASKCNNISSTLTRAKNGRKAWDKCIEYQERLVYPCVKSSSLLGGLTRVNYCLHTADELIIGGENAAYGEFPHMVLLGFGTSPQSATWGCGGTLISDRFILTAGHCTKTREGDVSFARLSLLKRTDPITSATKRLYNIGRIIKHPEYKPPQKYNDIALLETTTTISLDRFAVPACIHFGNIIRNEKAVATGWGNTKQNGKEANVLQKVTLEKFTGEECAENYVEGRLLKQGIVDTQICYGDRIAEKDACQGDSGGPLQIKNSDINCMYTIIGITSFGSGCGHAGIPGVYTRVANYAEWIENIVWP